MIELRKRRNARGIVPLYFTIFCSFAKLLYKVCCRNFKRGLRSSHSSNLLCTGLSQRRYHICGCSPRHLRFPAIVSSRNDWSTSSSTEIYIWKYFRSQSESTAPLRISCFIWWNSPPLEFPELGTWSHGHLLTVS
jgi:hypothetical protein